ncbi:uncharacterized protein LOC135151493 [Daucus carota subsp. sativus]|uniref:uncharacterized protein LOC135151493 n=1 Tax=Daucus carota subsp. sativus TaxID=79200 RepID=UPI00308397BF
MYLEILGIDWLEWKRRKWPEMDESPLGSKSAVESPGRERGCGNDEMKMVKGTSASKPKKAAKSDAAPSTAKRTRTSVATHVLKANPDVQTNTDEPVNSEAHLNSEAQVNSEIQANSEIPVNTEAASPQKQKRRRLVAAYDYDDLEPAHAVNSEPIPPNSDPVQTTSSTSSEVDEEIVCKEQATAEAETAVSDPKSPISDHGTPTPIPQSPMKIPEDAIVHDTAPENYRSDTVVEESDKVAMEALQSLAMTGAESIKPNSVAPITESDKAKSVPDPVQDAEKSTQDDTEDDDSSDDDNDDEAPVSHLQQKWESTSQYNARLKTLTIDSEPLPRDLQKWLISRRQMTWRRKGLFYL